MPLDCVTFVKVRLEKVPLPVPSEAAAAALHACSSSTSSHSAPAVEGMMPLWSSSPHDSFAVENVFGVEGDDDDAYSSIMCEDRPVRELVDLCILKRVSSVNNVLLLRVTRPVPPLQIFGFVQVNVRVILILVMLRL